MADLVKGKLFVGMLDSVKDQGAWFYADQTV